MISIRTAVEKDALFVNRLTRDVMKEYVENTWNSDAEREHYWDINSFNLDSTKIIQYNQRDVGRISITEMSDRMILDEIHILPVFQSKGIGTEILNQLLLKTRKNNKPTELIVLKANVSAKQFYERNNFKIIKDSEEHYFMRYENE